MKRIVLALFVAALFVRCSESAQQNTASKDAAATDVNKEDNYDSIRRADSIKRINFSKPQVKADTTAKQAIVTTATPATATTAKPAAAADPAIAKGKTLIANNDCLTCHKLDAKVVGPAYKDVAKKYTDKDIPTLAAKVINGGAGNWGSIPMIPHSDLSTADATVMVKYILSLK